MINEVSDNNLAGNLNISSEPTQMTIVQVSDLNSSLSLIDESSLTYDTSDPLNENEYNFFQDSQITIFSKNPSTSLFVLKDEGKNLYQEKEIKPVTTVNKQFFEAKIPLQATFELSRDDWDKLKQLQRGHRFKRGEWEDYFVTGMKESNKYCVFAFKDHYVNHSSIRKRRASMSRGGFCSDTIKLDGKKNFSANGYCVFTDCTVKFIIKMNSERQVHVFYEGQVKHAINEVNARYFRGKSRQELKETLKHTTPMREYLNRVENSKHLGVIGNVDYIGKSSTVYRRISSEAKDQFQALLQLRSHFIQQSIDKKESSLNPKLLGYIQMIQHIPGAIICFNQSQLNLFQYLFFQTNQSILYINSFRDASFVNTTMNSQKLYLYEMCLKLNESLLPLSHLITTNINANFSIKQWITLFMRSCNTIESNLTKFILCDNSMTLIETLLFELNNESFESYTNRVFLNLTTHSEFDSLNSELINEFNLKNTTSITNKILIHCCTNKIMIEISKLCRYYYYESAVSSTTTMSNSINNFNFGLYAFNVIVNSENLIDLQRSIYSFMCILYSDTINSQVKKSFDYLKSKLDLIESFRNNYYLFDFNFNEVKLKSLKESNSLNDLFGESIGLSAFEHYDSDHLEKLNRLNESSIFYKMCEKLYEKCKQDIDQCEYDETNLSHNPRKSHYLLYHFIKQFSSSLPLWTRICIKQTKNYPMTSNLHMDRFKSMLNEHDSRKDTVDLFIKKLHDDNENLINLYSKDLNKFKRINKKLTKTSILDDLLSSSEWVSDEDNSIHDSDSSSSVSMSSSSNDLLRIDTKRKHKSTDYLTKTNDETEIIIERETYNAADQLQLTKSDLDSLDESNSCITSQIIEFYLKMLQLNINSNESNFKVLTFPIKFYLDLRSNQTCCDESNNIFNFSLVLVPIKKNDTLGLAVIDFRKRKITYYDPYLLNDFECLKILTDFIDKQYYLFKKDKYDFRNWKISNDKSTTLLSTNNNNIKDTGVFVLFLSKRLANNQDLISIKHNEIELFRTQIKQEIIQHLIT